MKSKDIVVKTQL